MGRNIGIWRAGASRSSGLRWDETTRDADAMLAGGLAGNDHVSG
jgi:hypothetical protein